MNIHIWLLTCLQGLLRELLALCPEPGERHNTVLRALAASLSGRNMHEDAGMALVAAGELPGAMEAYRAGGQWRMVLVLAGAPTRVVFFRAKLCRSWSLIRKCNACSWDEILRCCRPSGIQQGSSPAAGWGNDGRALRDGSVCGCCSAGR